MVKHEGMILWFTGLPAAGKTTVSTGLYQRLKAQGAKVHLLDGDAIREMNCGRLGFTREDRITHMMQVGNMACMLKDHGVLCLIAIISPYREVRTAVIKKIGALEIFVDAPLAVCQSRDPKGLYARALRGEIKNFTGIDDPYEAPEAAGIHLRTDQESPEACVERVAQYLGQLGLVDQQDTYLERQYQAYPMEKLLSYFPFASLMLLRKNGFSEKGLAAFWDDCLQFARLRRYPYKKRIIFVAGLPKSGTTWMQKLLCMNPGYYSRTIYDPSRSILSHDISSMVFDLMPRYAHSVIKLHTRYTPDNFGIIRDYVDKFIVMYRDLRDMCVSRYYHIINEETHRHHQLYKSLPLAEGLLHSINIIRMEYVSWVKDWHDIAKAHSEAILEVRYEDLHADVRGCMGRVLAFFDLPQEEALLDRMAGSQLKKPTALSQSLAHGETQRKGIVGDWRNHFTQDHKDYFKEVAGQVLIDLGYETDLNW